MRCLIIFHFFLLFQQREGSFFSRSIWISSPAAFLFYAFIRHSSMLSRSLRVYRVYVHTHSCTCVCKDDFSNIMFLNLTRSYKLVKKKKKQRVIKRGKITELQWNGSLSALVLIQSVSKGLLSCPYHSILITDQVCQNIDWK